MGFQPFPGVTLNVDFLFSRLELCNDMFPSKLFYWYSPSLSFLEPILPEGQTNQIYLAKLYGETVPIILMSNDQPFLDLDTVCH